MLGIDLSPELDVAPVGDAAALPVAAAVIPEATLPGFTSGAAAAAPAHRGVLPSRVRGRTASRVYALSREQEYAYIQEDMRRLLVIAGILLLLMIALLFLVER